METRIRDNISKIIDENNLTPTGISKSDLVSLSLSKVFKKEYFKDNYLNAFLIKDEEGALWNSTGSMSFISDDSSKRIEGIVSSPDDESDFESQFAWSSETEIFVNKDEFISIKSIINAFKNSNSIEDISNNLQEIAKENRDSLFLFQSLFLSSIFNNEIYNVAMARTTLESDKSERYKNTIPCSVKGELRRKSYTKINNENFKELKQLFLNDISKKARKIKNIEFLENKYEKEINKILTELTSIHPEIEHSPDASDLDFYFIETNIGKNGFFDNQCFTAVDEGKSIVKTLDGFKDFYNEDSSFIDFIYKNPFSFSDYNRSRVNQIEGLSYIDDELLKPNDYSSQFFIVAKTKKGETVGTLSLDKNKAYSHLFKITGVCVKNSYRGQNISKKIYQKLAEVAINNDMVIHNNNYSPLGKLYLPKMKKELLDSVPAFVLIDENLENSFPNKTVNNAIQSYNRHSLIKIKELEINKSIKIKTVIKAYLKGKNAIFSKSKNTDIEYDELCNEGLKIFSGELEDKVKNRYKQKR